MNKEEINKKDSDILNVKSALQRAALHAFDQGLKNNTPVYVWENGKIVDATNDKEKINNPEIWLKPFRNVLIKYDDPLKPAALEDWDALK